MSPALELREIDQSELRLLDRMGGGDRPVLSLFLGLDQPEVPTVRARTTELESRLDEAEERLAAEASGEAELATLGECFDAIRPGLEGVAEEAGALHGVAFFCEPGSEPRAYALRRPPGIAVAAAFRDGPALEPLIEAMAGPSWGVAVVSRQRGRVFRGSDTGLVEVGEVDDEVHRRHSRGGWSQARFQRGIEKETRDHVERVAALLFALFERQPFERVAILAPPELLPVVERALHPYLRERLGGRVAIDIDRAGADEVLEQLAEPIAAWRREREAEALDRLAQRLGEGDGAVAGIEGVRSALGQQRVETLLVGRGSREEDTERAVEGAVAQGADVIVVGDEALRDYGRIAALLRY